MSKAVTHGLSRFILIGGPMNPYEFPFSPWIITDFAPLARINACCVFFACGRRWAGLDLCQVKPGQAVTLWLADLGLGLNPDNFLKWDLTFKYSPSTWGASAKKKYMWNYAH